MYEEARRREHRQRAAFARRIRMMHHRNPMEVAIERANAAPPPTTWTEDQIAERNRQLRHALGHGQQREQVRTT